MFVSVGNIISRNPSTLVIYIIDEIEERDNSNDDFNYDFDETKKYQIKSIYDKKLVSIFRVLWTGKEWDPKQKVWKFTEFAFQNIIKKVFEYLSSTGEPYKLTYIDEILTEVNEGLEKDFNYRQSVLNEIPKCHDELDGFCNHAGDYIYCDKIVCTNLECSDYFSPNTTPKKIIEIITKLHIIDNYDYFKNE